MNGCHGVTVRVIEVPEQLPNRVSARELDVAVRAVGRNLDIALELGISENTVKAHLQNVGRKTGLVGRAAIAVWAADIVRAAVGGETVRDRVAGLRRARA